MSTAAILWSLLVGGLIVGMVGLYFELEENPVGFPLLLCSAAMFSALLVMSFI